MHTRDFFYDNYKNHPEPVLTRIAGEYPKLTAEAQEALRDVLRERGMDELLATLESTEEKKKDLSHLTADEVRALINRRLEQGEKPELIKMDLRDKGVNLLDMSLQESRSEENLERRFMELQKEGKTKIEIEAKLKEEFNLSKTQSAKIPERLRSTGTGLIVAGGVLLMTGAPFLAVLIADGEENLKLPLLMTGSGIVLLAWGIRKRMAAAKFIKDNETLG
jgi:hypothetical protein